MTTEKEKLQEIVRQRHELMLAAAKLHESCGAIRGHRHVEGSCVDCGHSYGPVSVPREEFIDMLKQLYGNIESPVERIDIENEEYEETLLVMDEGTISVRRGKGFGILIGLSPFPHTEGAPEVSVPISPRIALRVSEALKVASCAGPENKGASGLQKDAFER